jgi:hypothetical protein
MGEGRYEETKDGEETTPNAEKGEETEHGEETTPASVTGQSRRRKRSADLCWGCANRVGERISRARRTTVGVIRAWWTPSLRAYGVVIDCESYMCPLSSERCKFQIVIIKTSKAELFGATKVMRVASAVLLPAAIAVRFL